MAAGANDYVDQSVNENVSVDSDSLVECVERASSSNSLKWDDSAWCLPQRKRLRLETPIPTRKRKRRRRFGGPTAEEKRTFIVPAPKSIQREICFRIQRGNPIFSPRNTSCSSSHPDGSLYVLYRWLRVRLAAGMIGSSLVLLHGMLAKEYEQAKMLLGKVYNDEEECDSHLFTLLKIRKRLAGLWCIYAHIILDLGQQALAQTNESNNESNSFSSTPTTPKHKTVLLDHVTSSAKRRGRGRPRLSGSRNSRKAESTPAALSGSRKSRKIESTPAADKGMTPRRQVVGRHRRIKMQGSRCNPRTQETEVSRRDIYNHAMSILMAARTCPLVRNHTLIVLSLGRLILSGHALETKPGSKIAELPIETVSSNIQSAIAVCWDAMDCCHNNHDALKRFQMDESPQNSIEFIANFKYDNRPVSKEARISPEELESTMTSVLDLPSRLQEDLESKCTIFNDRNAIRSLCVELNRLSRLGERIQKPGAMLSATNDGDTLLDDLPLLAAFDHIVEKTQREGSVCKDIEYSQENSQRDCAVLWQW
jgi:hypothetical protein